MYELRPSYPSSSRSASELQLIFSHWCLARKDYCNNTSREPDQLKCEASAVYITDESVQKMGKHTIYYQIDHKISHINCFFFARISLKNISIAMAMLVLIFFAESKQKIIQFIYVIFYNLIGTIGARLTFTDKSINHFDQ